MGAEHRPGSHDRRNVAQQVLDSCPVRGRPPIRDIEATRLEVRRSGKRRGALALSSASRSVPPPDRTRCARTRNPGSTSASVSNVPPMPIAMSSQCAPTIAISPSCPVTAGHCAAVSASTLSGCGAIPEHPRSVPRWYPASSSARSLKVSAGFQNPWCL